MRWAWPGTTTTALIVIEAQAPVEDATVAEETLLEDSEEGPDALRVRIEPPDARAFVERARRVIAAGRPPCPLCGQPLDPSGHVCPRQNGYHRSPPYRIVATPDPDLTPALELPVADALALLERGELSIEGRLVDASNATLYCGDHARTA